MKAVVGFLVGALMLIGLVVSYKYWPKVEAPYHGTLPKPVVTVKNIHGKLITAAGKAGLELLMDDAKNFGIDPKALLASIFDGELTNGFPPRDAPVLMIVNKATNEVQYWRLTPNVSAIRLEGKQLESVELKMTNETPLRVEFWFQSPQEVIVDVVMRE